MQHTAHLAGQTVLVTGASRGIGAATARCLHRDGATVAVHYGRDVDAARRVVDELGERAFAVQADLSAPEGPQQLWHAVLEERDRIHSLVNNAGAWIASPIADPEQWHRGWAENMALNLTAAAELCRLAIGHFQSHGGGAIVNVTSRSAHRGDDRDHLAYGAAKAGLLGLTKGIARGYGSDGVLAYAIAPGWVSTDLAATSLTSLDLSALPLGGPTPPEDVAETIAFLLAGRARHLTGATLDITGADYVR